MSLVDEKNIVEVIDPEHKIYYDLCKNNPMDPDEDNARQALLE